MLSCLPVLTSVLFPTRLFCLSLGFLGLWLCRGDSRLARVVPLVLGASFYAQRRARCRPRRGALRLCRAAAVPRCTWGLPPGTQQLVGARCSLRVGARRDPQSLLWQLVTGLVEGLAGVASLLSLSGCRLRFRQILVSPFHSSLVIALGLFFFFFFF